MYRVFLQSRKLIVVETSEREFKQKYPGSYELIQAVAEYDNLDKVIQRLQKDYRTEEVIRDYQELKRWGVKYFTEAVRAKWLASKFGKPRPAESNAKVSAKMKGKSNFEGKQHANMTKIMIASSRVGKRTIKEGQRWCHHPESGKELRCHSSQKPRDFVWGRSPEIRDYFKPAKRTAT